MANGEPTARLARELGGSRKQLPTLRQRSQAKLNATAPTGIMPGPAFEADALDQHAGEKTHAPCRAQGPPPEAGQEAERARHLCEGSSPDAQRELARDG
jgi:hypothetical protein